MSKNSHANYLRKNPTLYVDTHQKLHDVFPHVFNYKKPLAIGIYGQIRDQVNVTSRDLHFFLHRYCDSYRYLECLKEGKRRYNVDGSFNGDVTADEADNAINDLLTKYLRRK